MQRLRNWTADVTSLRAIASVPQNRLDDSCTLRVIATREFDTSAAAGEDPYGGVLSATRTVQTAIENLATSCAEAMYTPPMGK